MAGMIKSTSSDLSCCEFFGVLLTIILFTAYQQKRSFSSKNRYRLYLFSVLSSSFGIVQFTESALVQSTKFIQKSLHLPTVAAFTRIQITRAAMGQSLCHCVFLLFQKLAILFKTFNAQREAKHHPNITCTTLVFCVTITSSSVIGSNCRGRERPWCVLASLFELPAHTTDAFSTSC